MNGENIFSFIRKVNALQATRQWLTNIHLSFQNLKQVEGPCTSCRCVGVCLIASSGWRYKQCTNMLSPNPVSSLLNLLSKNSTHLPIPWKTIFLSCTTGVTRKIKMLREVRVREPMFHLPDTKRQWHWLDAVVSQSKHFFTKRNSPAPRLWDEGPLRNRALSAGNPFPPAWAPWRPRLNLSGSKLVSLTD